MKTKWWKASRSRHNKDSATYDNGGLLETGLDMEISLKVGIIGFGGAGMAQLWHFNEILGCQVIAIYDPKPDGVRRANLRAAGVLATHDFEAFMASGINTVAVCSPDSTHADYVVAAIDAGFHVISEKPLTDSLEGCRRVLKAEAGNRGVVVAVQHQMRCLPVHLEMKRLIRSGKLGRISYLEGYYVHNLTERAFLYDNWRATDNATPLLYSGCHFVDLLRWLLDDEVEEIVGMANHLAFAKYPESDLNVILLRFKSGVIGKVVVAFGAGRPQDHSVRIYGSDMSIENNLLFSKSGEYEVFCRPHLAKHEPPIIPNAPPFYHLRGHHYRARMRRWVERSRLYWFAKLLEGLMKLKTPDHHSGYGIATYPLRLYPHSLAVRASLENFVAAIRGQQHLVCSLKDSARTVATCLAGVEAYRTGKNVKVADYWLPDFE